MRRCLPIMTAFFLCVTILTATRAGDDAAVRAIIDKALRAQGGATTNEKLAAVTGKMKGVYHGAGQPIPFTADVMTHLPERRKVAILADVGGIQFRLTHVLNGNKGWIKTNEDTGEMDADKLAEARHDAYAEWVATLVPLKDKAFVLEAGGDATVDDKPAVRVRVIKTGHADINLFFDKGTGLLAKTECRRKDDNGQELTEESFMSDYREMQGTRQAMKFLVKRDGKVYVEGEMTECHLLERLDDTIFARP